jgi:hypothetical protein
MNSEVYTRAITLIGGRYFIVAGISFLLFYVIFRKKWSRGKIQQRFPVYSDYLREIFFSVITIAIFGIKVYTPVQRHCRDGMGILFFCFPCHALYA